MYGHLKYKKYLRVTHTMIDYIHIDKLTTPHYNK